MAKFHELCREGATTKPRGKYKVPTRVNPVRAYRREMIAKLGGIRQYKKALRHSGLSATLHLKSA